MNNIDFDTNKIIIVIQNDKDVPLGNFEKWILDFDSNIKIVTIVAGVDEIPSDSSAPVIILGGENNAYDDDKCPWLSKEKTLIKTLVDKNVPVFGICLGFQLGCVALGGKVEVSHPRGKEIGIHKLYLSVTSDDDRVLGGLREDYFNESEDIFVPQWHGDSLVILPPNCSVLAASESYIQSIRKGSFLGVQFHPEVNFETISVWAKDHDNKEFILHDFVAKNDCVEKFAKKLLNNFLKNIYN